MAITKLIADSITSGAIASTPAFNASLGSNQTLSFNVTTLVSFNTELYDVGSCYNNTGSTVTLNGISAPAYSFAPNVAGKYSFYGQIYIINTNSGADFIHTASVWKSGTRIYMRDMRYDTDGGTNVSISGTIEMNGTSDYIQFYGQHRNLNSSSSLDLLGNNADGRIYSYFTAHKIIE
tara:strand:+ start:23 stop:556 length:534 start_codon:yes stop_codon:yes gene_type:complete